MTRAPTRSSSACRSPIRGSGICADIDDLDEFVLREIEHFFDIYKQIEPGKMAETKGFRGPDEAYAELEASRRRYVDP